MFIDVKIKEAISKAWNWAIRAGFSIKSGESTKQLLYFCNLFSASFRKDYLGYSLICCIL